MRQEKDPLMVEIRKNKEETRMKLQEVLQEQNALSLQVNIPSTMNGKTVPEEHRGVRYIRYTNHSSYRNVEMPLLEDIIQTIFEPGYLEKLYQKEHKEQIVKGSRTPTSPLSKKMLKAVSFQSVVTWISTIFNHLLTEEIVTKRQVPTVAKSKVRESTLSADESKGLSVNQVTAKPYHAYLAFRYLDQKGDNHTAYNQRIHRISDVKQQLAQLEKDLVIEYLKEKVLIQTVQVVCGKESYSYQVAIVESRKSKREKEDPDSTSPTVKCNPGVKRSKEEFASQLVKILPKFVPNPMSATTLIEWLANSPQVEVNALVEMIVQEMRNSLFNNPAAVAQTSSPVTGEDILKQDHQRSPSKTDHDTEQPDRFGLVILPQSQSVPTLGYLKRKIEEVEN